MKMDMRKNIITVLSQITMYLIIIVLYFLLVEIFNVENKVLNKVLNNILGIGIIAVSYIILRDKYKINLINWAVGMIVSWAILFILKVPIVNNVFTDVGVVGAGSIVPILGEGMGVLRNIGLTILLQMAIIMVANYVKMNKHLKKKALKASSNDKSTRANTKKRKEPEKKAVKRPESKIGSTWNEKKQEIKEKFKSKIATQKKLEKEPEEKVKNRTENKTKSVWSETKKDIKEKVKNKIDNLKILETLKVVNRDSNRKKTHIRISNIITYIIIVVTSVGIKLFGLESVWGDTTSSILIMALAQFILLMNYIYFKIKYDIEIIDWIREIFVLIAFLFIYNPLNGGIVMIIVDLFKEENMFLSDVINLSRVTKVLFTTILYGAFFLAVQVFITLLFERLDNIEEKMQKANKIVPIVIVQVLTGVLLIATYEHFVLNQMAMTILIMAYIIISYIYDMDIVDWFKGMLVLLLMVGVYNKYMENTGTYFFSNVFKFNLILSIKIYVIQLLIKEIIYYFMNSETLEKIEIENYD